LRGTITARTTNVTVFDTLNPDSQRFYRVIQL